MARNLVNNFRYGETSQLLAGRIDSEVYSQGASHVENMVCLKQGGMKRRPPLKFLFDLTYYGIKWIKDFTIDAEHSFVLLFSTGAIYFGEWSKVGKEEGFSLKQEYYYDGESVYQGDFSIAYNEAILETLVKEGESENNLYINEREYEKFNGVEYNEALGINEFPELRFAQYYDSMYIVHKNHPMLRVDYDRLTDTFSLVQPRIIVNQDVDYRLSKEELDKGYTISQELGWEDFKDTQLNTPPNADGTKNYPSNIKIVGDQMFLFGTEAHPDYIWKSRTFGSSQILDTEDIHSIQDFVQFQIVETDEQTLKDTADFPKTEQIDEDGFPVVKFDESLRPSFRIPKGSEPIYDSRSVTTGGVTTTIEGFSLNGVFIAVRMYDDEGNPVSEDGFPVYIDMNGNKLYNRILYWERENPDGTKTQINYVAGMYQDYNFDNCYMLARLTDDGRPITDVEDDFSFEGNQLFKTYIVPMYSQYGDITISSETDHTIVNIWTSNLCADLVYHGVTFPCKYLENTGHKMSKEGYQDYYEFVLASQISSTDLFVSEDITTYSVVGWTEYESEIKYDDIPTDEPVPVAEEGASYVTINSVDDGRLYSYKEITWTAHGNWKESGSTTSVLGFNKKSVVSSLPSYGTDGEVVYMTDSNFLIGKTYKRYVYSITWESVEKTYTDVLTNHGKSQSRPSGASAGRTYVEYVDINTVTKDMVTANVTVHVYSNTSAVDSIFDNENFPYFPPVDKFSYVAGGLTVDGVTYTATTNAPAIMERTSNEITIKWGGIARIRFYKEVRTASDGGLVDIWKTDATSFNIALEDGDNDDIYPATRSGIVYQYYRLNEAGKEELIAQANAYEEVDLSATSEMTLYNKALVKTATSSCGMEFQVNSGRSDGIKWVECGGGQILIGTNNSEWTLNYDINPLSGKANWYSSYGSNVGFASTINTDTVFLQRNNALRLFYSDYYGLHTTDVSATAEGITNGTIHALVSKQVPNPHVFLLKSNGDMVSLCIDRDLGIQGWTRLSFENATVKSIAVVENPATQTLLSLCTKIVNGVTHTLLCQFDEDFSSDEEVIYKDFGATIVETEDTAYDLKKIYYVMDSGSYRESRDADYSIEYVTIDGQEFKQRSFKSGVTYYEASFNNFTENYTSKITTNAYEGQLNDGSFTIGMYKSVNRIIIRALDTGRVSVFTSDKTKNRTLYNVSPNKEGLGDFTININGGSAKDTMVTIESVDGDPMTLLALAYDIQVDGDGNKH